MLVARGHLIWIIRTRHRGVADITECYRASQVDAKRLRVHTGDMQLVHRGWNPRGKPRHTLHGALWTADTPVMMHEQGQELGVVAALAALEQATLATTDSDSKVARVRKASVWADCLRGYLRNSPPDATEAGSLLKFLRHHQREGSTPSAAPQLTLRTEEEVKATASPAALKALRLETQDFLFEQDDLDGWTGGRVWEAGKVLARVLTIPSWAERVRGARVLELGTGTGLVGLTCATLGAKSVCMTDRVLFVAEHNLRLNFAEPERRSISVRRVEWGDSHQLAELLAEQHGSSSGGKPFDLIVTADTLYSRGDDRSGTGVGPPGGGAVEKLAQTIAACSGPQTLVIVAAPEEGTRFFAAMARHGFGRPEDISRETQVAAAIAAVHSGGDSARGVTRVRHLRVAVESAAASDRPDAAVGTARAAGRL